MTVIDRFKQQAQNDPRRIVYPEGSDERIVDAAKEVAEAQTAIPTVLAKTELHEALTERLGPAASKVALVDPRSSPELERYARSYLESRRLPSERAATRLVSRPLFFGAMMVACGDADGMVAGIDHETARVIEAATLGIGLSDGVSGASSVFIMVVPECLGERDKVLIFGDAAVAVNPTSGELAEIAVTSARTATVLLGLEPKVALLSFSTKGSADHEMVDKVAEATKLACEAAPDLAIDGELQGDSALVPRVAQKKCGDSVVAGQANVLIFPDLNAANIAYKLTQYLANADAYGPIMQGFRKPVNDLSRGASVADVVGVTAITVVQAQRS